MNQLFQNGFFSFEVVSSQEIASNNTCYLTAACTRCMRRALSFVTFLSSIFYLLNTLCGSLDLMCMSLFILQCLQSSLSLASSERGEAGPGALEILASPNKGEDLTHVFAAKSVSQKVQHTIKKPLVTTAENQRRSEPLFFQIHSIHPLTLQKG